MPKWKDQLVVACGASASRVARTCDRLGAHARVLVEEASVSVSDNQPSAIDPNASVLRDWDSVFAAARRISATALHPGIGGDASSPKLAERAIRENLLWVGASPEILRFAESREEVLRCAQRVGFAVPPCNEIHPVTERERIGQRARALGFPIVVTCLDRTGRPFEVVAEDPEHLTRVLDELTTRAMCESSRDVVGICRRLRGPRRVSVDFVGLPGGALVLGLRDTTAEFAGDTVVEETPAVSVAQSGWLQVLDRTARFSIESGYVGLGTVNAILDETDCVYFDSLTPSSNAGNVTIEMATGLDLVELQLRCAFREFDKIAEETVPVVTGHVVTAHIRSNGQEGAATWVRQASAERSADLWIEPSSLQALPKTTPARGAVLCTIVAHGEHRPAAIRKLRSALSQYALGETSSNIQILRALLAEDAFWDVPVDLSLSDELYRSATS